MVMKASISETSRFFGTHCLNSEYLNKGFKSTLKITLSLFTKQLKYSSRNVTPPAHTAQTKRPSLITRVLFYLSKSLKVFRNLLLHVIIL